jgi:hypothetical protein
VPQSVVKLNGENSLAKSTGTGRFWQAVQQKSNYHSPTRNKNLALIDELQKIVTAGFRVK